MTAPSRPFVQEMGERDTALGVALYIKVRTEDYRVLSWTEVWETFADRYPGRWAVSMFPSADHLVDDANVYHLFVLESAYPPAGLNISRRDLAIP